MVVQYPHKLVLTSVGNSSQDGNGNWIAGSPSSLEIICRAEANDKGRSIQTGDGIQIIYAWLIYAPIPIADIVHGTKVVIQDENDNQIGGGDVKRFSKGQLNARIWL
jgi:hypothetical protein